MDYSSEHDRILSIFWYTQACLSCMLNAILLLLIVKKSPKTLYPYTIYLASSSITDMVVSIMGSLTQMRQPSVLIPLGVFIGPLTQVGSKIAYCVIAIQSVATVYSVVCFPLIFRFRYKSLELLMPPYSRYDVYRQLLGAFTFSLLQGILITLNDFGSCKFTLVEGRFSRYILLDERSAFLSAKLNMLGPVSVAIIYSISTWYIVKTFKTLRAMQSSHLLPAVVSHHRQLLAAMVVQIVLPIVMVLLPYVISIAISLFTNKNDVSEFLLFPFSSFVLSSLRSS